MVTLYLKFVGTNVSVHSIRPLWYAHEGKLGMTETGFNAEWSQSKLFSETEDGYF